MSSEPPSSAPDDRLRQQLDAAHRGLLRIHKALIDHERARYERTHGPVAGPVQLLQLLLHDPFFAWLRPMSALIAQIDEFVSSDDALDQNAGEALLTETRQLLTPTETGHDEFGREYYRAIQESPEIAMMHGEWRRDLPARQHP